MSTDTWYNKNNVTSISLSPDPFKIVKNEKVVLSNLKNKFENLKIKDTNTIASKQKHQFLAKVIWFIYIIDRFVFLELISCYRNI